MGGTVSSTWGHSHASSVVKNWRVKEVASWAEVECGAHTGTLHYPNPWYRVAVSFSLVVGHPEWVRVRATNWRCEDEPNGVFAAEDCRNFYRQLLRAGFVKEL